jgi:hypothetical protein
MTYVSLPFVGHLYLPSFPSPKAYQGSRRYIQQEVVDIDSSTDRLRSRFVASLLYANIPSSLFPRVVFHSQDKASMMLLPIETH